MIDPALRDAQARALHVEVGAGTCIDRGSWRDTTVGDHTKIDNLVQVGHNVIIGHGCLICAHSALGEKTRP